ncbi:MAG: hypothetical protein ABIP48_17415, partial [Planctomycetota bacterium]
KELGRGLPSGWYRYRAVTIEAATWISTRWRADQIVDAWASEKDLQELSRRWFSRGLDELTPGQLAFVAVRHSPRYDWFCKDAAHAVANRNHLLGRMYAAGLIEDHQLALGQQDQLPAGFVAGARKWPCNRKAGMCGPLSDSCRIWGACKRGARGCEADCDMACAASWACKGHGLCAARGGRCVGLTQSPERMAP